MPPLLAAPICPLFPGGGCECVEFRSRRPKEKRGIPWFPPLLRFPPLLWFPPHPVLLPLSALLLGGLCQIRQSDNFGLNPTLDNQKCRNVPTNPTIPTFFRLTRPSSPTPSRGSPRPSRTLVGPKNVGIVGFVGTFRHFGRSIVGLSKKLSDCRIWQSPRDHGVRRRFICCIWRHTLITP